MDSAMNTALGRGSAMSANVRAMKDALMPVRLHRSNSLRIPWEEAFQDTWGHTPWDFSVWEHWYTKREGFDPTLWFLACEGQQIAGMCLCNYWIGDGFVDTLAVRRPWRRLGLGLALLHQSFGAFYQRQTRTVKLMVDSQNLTGATRLYERAGMHITQLYYTYEKELRPGKELRTTTVSD